MRMVIISLAVMILLISLWVWFHFTSIEPTTNYYYEELNGMSELIIKDQWQKVEDDMIHYSEKWDATRNLWVYFINQSDIDNIDSSIKRLDVFIKNREKIMAQAELEHLRVLFNIIKENECLSLENIM